MSNKSNNPISIIQNQPKQVRVIRYRATSLGNATTITRGDILNALVAVTNTSTSAIPLFRAVRLDRIKFVAYADDTSGPETLCFKWTGDRSPETCVTTVCSNAVPAVLVVRPPERSLAGYWSTIDADTTEVLFRIDAFTPDLYMDLHITYILDDGGVTTQTLASASSFTGIAAVRLPNDGATTDFIPQGLTGTSFA